MRAKESVPSASSRSSSQLLTSTTQCSRRVSIARVLSRGSLLSAATAALLSGCLGQVKPSEHGNLIDGGTDELDGGRDSGGSTGNRDGSSDNGDGDGDGDTGNQGADAGTDGAVTIPEGSVHVIVAAGRAGRTTISCDDGRTWIANRSESNATQRCWGQAIGLSQGDPNYLECDHSSSQTTGLVYHNGAFFKGLGWGVEARTLRSTDGVDWINRQPKFIEQYLALVEYPGGVIAARATWTTVTTDDGFTWVRAPQVPDGTGHIRLASISAYQGGTLVMKGDSGMFWSRLPIATYQAADNNPCGTSAEATNNGMTSGGSVTVLAMKAGNLCTSSDGGKSWTQHNIAQALRTNPVWDGHDFYVWGRQQNNAKLVLFKSPNGTDWTPTVTNLDVDRWESMGATTLGNFVAVTAVYDGGYENQKFARSEDGVTWETLQKGAFTGSCPANSTQCGHPISQFAAGVVPANLYCPGN